MGSHKEDGRERDPLRRRRNVRSRRALPFMESLEDRRLLAGPGDVGPAWKPSSPIVGDVKNGPLALAGANLIKIYQEYQQYAQNGGVGQFNSSLKNIVRIAGTNVGVDVVGYGDFQSFVTSLTNIGMQVTATDANHRIVEGYLPISQLPTAARLPQIVGMAPNYLPVTNVGSANNQGDQSLRADVARTTYGVDGTGVKVGVLSDSVNLYDDPNIAGVGLTESYNTKDLDANNPVQVLRDLDTTGGATGTDEGRAMLEQVKDIATGSSLAFYSGFNGQVDFANGIRALAQVGARVIVDDLTYFAEPMFQDGLIEQAVTDVVQNFGVSYFSSAGNAKDSGYSTQFRGVNATVTGIGSGRFLNFNPNPGGTVTTGLQVTVNNGLGVFSMQWDNPFFVTNGVTTDLDVFFLDASNNIVASGTSNNIAQGTPVEIFGVPAGTYTMVIQVAAGSPDPGRVQIVNAGGGRDAVFDQKFGTAGGTFYPSTFGHNAGADAMGTAAIPWWITPPYSTSTPLVAEPFSSFGPNISIFNPDGSRRSAPVTLQKPDFTAPDGNDTSFFDPGFFLSTVNPPFPGEPASKVELDGNKLPNFFGTSSAAPNLAAVAALMKQLAPSASRNDIYNAMKASVVPVNGQSPGIWQTQAGFGLVQAPAALAAIDLLRVVATTPANGSQLTSLPAFIDVSFSRAINFATVDSTDLVFTKLPTGVSVAVGTPIQKSSTVVSYPILVTTTAGTKANGDFAFKLSDGAVRSVDNKSLAAFTGAFTVNDTIAPKVIGTILNGRAIVVQFSEAMRPETINRDTFLVVRRGSADSFNKPGNVLLNALPGFAIRYDATRNWGIVDLSEIPQSLLPSDDYAIVVTDAATDLVGNKLDGEFLGPPPTGDNGVFPSGNDTEGGNFYQLFSNVILRAPQVASVRLDPSTGPTGFSTSDTGIAGDQNTRVSRPFFTGQILANFPATFAGAKVYIQFNGLHGGTFDLRTGTGNRGSAGNPDIVTTTDAFGRFSFQAPADLPDGFQVVRVVVEGQSEIPPIAGLSSQLDTSFRVDTSLPIVTVAPDSPVQPETLVPNLSAGIKLTVTDPVRPSAPGAPLAVPTQLQIPAIDPVTASNISNYRLINVGSDNSFGTADDTDLSGFITGATFTSTSSRTATGDPYTGTISLTFAPGLPSGRYLLIAKTPVNGTGGLTDAAGNPIDGDTSTPTPDDFRLFFTLQPEAVYITTINAVTPNPDDVDNPILSDPRSYFELAVPGTTARATAPPTSFYIDFSTPLDPSKDYNEFVQLLRSANSANAAPDGDFGTDPSFTSGTGYSRVTGTTVTLVNAIVGASFGQRGFQNRLRLDLPAGTTLAADHYRLFIPNTLNRIGQDLRIFDIFGNQLDGEFLGNPTAAGWKSVVPPGGDNSTGAQIIQSTAEDFLPDGTYRPGISGDGKQGGSFETAYVVVPNANVIYARPDYYDDPFLTADDPDGSIAKPYAALAPEGNPNATVNGGDLNSSANFGTGFDARFDRNGNGRFDRSALVAAQKASSRGPVVVVALPGAPQRDSKTGAIIQQTFVIQAPQGADRAANDASVSIPFDTAMVFSAGSAVKLLNASIYVQNQGSSLIVQGDANNPVNFTSYLDDAVGGDTNNDKANSTARGADWGGFLFRTFDDSSNGGRPLPVAPGPIYPTPTKLGISGADDALSSINFANIAYAGGAVPQTDGYRFDAITMFNSRPAVTNAKISFTGGPSSAQAAISADMDSLREDALARGPLLRRLTLLNNSINGLLVRAEENGIIQPTDAMTYVDNPTTEGGVRNYTIDDPIPTVFVARMEVGTLYHHNSGGSIDFVADRLYVQPGMLLKFQRGAGVDVRVSPGGFGASNLGVSINLGDRTYIQQYDLHPSLSPTDPVPAATPNDWFRDGKFYAQTVGDARVVLTSFFDDNATTSYFDPVTGQSRVIVAALDSDNGGPVNLPTAGNVPPLARWGGISVASGAKAIIDESDFRFGGGQINEAGGTIAQRDVLAFEFASGRSVFGTTTGALGTRVMITNNNFNDNAQAAMSITPDGLLAADPLTPLNSGNGFFRGNVMTGNGLNGMEVLADVLPSGPPFSYFPNLDVDSVWDDTDLIYVLRGTIRLRGAREFSLPTPDPNQLQPELKPFLSLTIQSSLPDTLLADGSQIARPGESVMVKMLNPGGTGSAPGDGINGANLDNNAGAGFIVGVDDGIDPTAGDPFIDPGAFSQIRILGLAANETIGQKRVPAVLTSLRDATAFKTVRGINMGDAGNPTIAGNTTAPAAGDAGNIVFGSLALTDYNPFDPRDGNLIDNADIRYMSRIEMQSGGIVDIATGSYDDDRLGTSTPAAQFNASRMMTISNSNLANFRDVAVLERTGLDALTRSVTGGTGGIVARASNLRAQPNQLFIVNTTIANSPVGVRVTGEPGGETSPLQTELVMLNNTLYNNPIGVDAIASTGPDPRAHIHLILMDNIFDTSTTAAVQTAGQMQGSIMQYNLLHNSGAVTGPISGDNYGQVDGDPRFRDPANGDFSLLPNSAAIDAARSEMNLDRLTTGATVATLRVIADQVLDSRGGIRNLNAREADGFSTDPTSILTLPGSTIREPGFGGTPQPYPNLKWYDEWIPALPANGGVPGPAAVAGVTLNYKPITGERDILGFLRLDAPGVANVGFGSRPYFDLGAYEYRALFPPHVINANPGTPGSTTDPAQGVQAVVTDPTSASGTRNIDIYKIGGIAGISQSPQYIIIGFDSLLDPATVNNKTILLQATGGDGIFGNANSAQDKFIDLSGKIAFDTASKHLVINLAGSNLTLGNDVYRIIVQGNGSNVVRDPQGNALDGENLDAAGLQRALPSGDGFPGGNFVVTFSIDTNPPAVKPGTLVLDPGSDTGARDFITRINTPTFTGTITDVFPPANPVLGQTVLLDFAGPDGVFGRLIPGTTPGTFIVDPTDPAGRDDRINIGSALTDAKGNFQVTVGQDAANTGLVTDRSPLPDSNYNVGIDGIFGTSDDTGASRVRVRAIDVSGNRSSATDVNAQTTVFVDTRGPRISGTDPLPNAQANVSSSGQVTVSFVVNENLDAGKVNASTIRVTRSGGDLIFGNGNDQQLTINAGSLSIQPLGTAQGSELVKFTITGVTVNDLYRVTLVGTGANAITDIAGNALDGEPNGGSFPSGDGTPGGDYNLDFVAYNAAFSRRIFVGPATGTGTPTGTRSNPYRTIQAGIDAATVGDIVMVLPAVYTESVKLKSYTRVLATDPRTTDTSAFTPGQALQTVIRAPVPTSGSSVTVAGLGLLSLSNLPTELAGFTIASPLSGNPATSPIQPGSQALQLTNSDILVDKNYIIDSDYGVVVGVGGINAPVPRFENNGIVGNNNGILVNDIGAVSFRGGKKIDFVNNTFAFNTFGLTVVSSGPQTQLAEAINNIFASNNDRNGFGAAIYSSSPNRLSVRNNMFFNNGANAASPADDALGVGGGFDPSKMSSTPDQFGNFTGNPAFANARDPRPNADGPANFFLDANFDLTLRSDAIDNAINSLAPAIDFRTRVRIDIANKGRTGLGPADVGAFEYNGLYGIAGPTGSSTVRTASIGTDSGTAATAAIVTDSTDAGSTDAGAAVTSSATTTSTPATPPAPTVVVNQGSIAPTTTTSSVATPAHRKAAARAKRHAGWKAYLGSRFRKG